MVSFVIEKNIKQTKPLPISGNRTGLYQDFLIENLSSRVMYAGYPNNTAKTLEPQHKSTTTSAGACIRITFTVGNGILNEGYQDGSAITNVQRYEVSIPTFKIAQDPYFLEDLGIVLCTEEQLPIITHPYTQPDYSDIVNEAISRLDIGKNTSMYFLANDPTGSCSELYVFLLGVAAKVPVSSIPAKESSLSVMLVQNGKQLTQHVTTFEAIEKHEGIIRTEKGVTFYVAKTDWELERLVKLKPVIEPPSNNAHELEHERAKHQVEVNSLKSDYEEKFSKLEQLIKQKDLHIDDFKMKYEREKLGNVELENKLASYRGVMNTHEELVKHNSSINSNKSKEKQSNVKLLETAIKVGIPLLLMIGTWVIAKKTN